MQRKRLTFRFTDDLVAEIDELASAYGMTKTNLINSLIRLEYDRYKSDPKVQEAIEKINLMKEFAYKITQTSADEKQQITFDELASK